MKQIYCHTDWAEIAGYFHQQIKDYRLQADWKMIWLTYEWMMNDEAYNKPQTQYLEMSLYNWFWWNTYVHMLHDTPRKGSVILKSESGFNKIRCRISHRNRIFFVNPPFMTKAQHFTCLWEKNCVKISGSSLFYSIQLQLRSLRWHYFVNRLLFLLRPPHRSKLIDNKP